MKARRISVPALALVLLAAQGSIPAGAQTRGLSHADSLAFQRVDRSVTPHSRLRVLDETRSFEARGSDVTLQGIRAAAPGGTDASGHGPVSWSEIQRVQVRGNDAGRGALIGGATGALLGGALLVIVSTADFGLGGSDDPSAGEVVGVTLGFSTAGAIVGGTIGALIPRWKTIHSWAGF